MAASNDNHHHIETGRNAIPSEPGLIIEDRTSDIVASGHQSHQGANRYVLSSTQHQIATTALSDVVDDTQTVQFGPGTDFATYDDFFLPPWKSWSEPYEAMLDFLATQGLFEMLPVDECGVLHVSVPFCSAFMECQTLSSFLSRIFQTRPGVTKVSILGTDLIVNASYCWDRKEKYVAKKYPYMNCQLRQMDLEQELLPKCSLSLGIHPEANAGNDCWRHILANVIKSARGGVCIFATFFEGEVKAVLNACRPLGVNFDVHENPYYRSHPVGSPPFLRFLLVGVVPQAIIESPQSLIIDKTREESAEVPQIEYVDLYIEVPVLKHRIVPVVTVKKKFVEVPVPMYTEVDEVECQHHAPLVTGKRTIVDIPNFEVVTKVQKLVEVPGIHEVAKIEDNVRTIGKPNEGANNNTHGKPSSTLLACMGFAVCLPVHACFPNRAR